MQNFINMQTILRALLLAMVTVLVIACGDTDNTEPPAELVEFEPALQVERLWQVNTGDGAGQLYLKLSPLITDDKIVVTDRHGEVAAYELESGKRLWKTELDMPVSGGVGGDADHLVVTGTNGHVVMLDAGGKVIWSVDASSEVLAPAQIAAGLVVIRSVDGRISALRLKDGSEQWSFKRDVPALSLRGNSVPIITQGYIFAGLDNGRLVTLDLLSGKTIFDIAIATPSGRSELERLVDIDGHSVIEGDTLYMASYQGKVISLDVRRGQLNWSRPFSSFSGVELAASTLFSADERDHIWAFDASNGATLWKQDKLQARQVTRPVAMGSTVLVADFEGYLHWLSPFDGRFLARVQTDDAGVIVAPQVYNNTAYVLSRDGELSAYRITEPSAD
jgi:outer membrane protein assembly factor BamB